MKKTLLSVAIILASTLGITATAQSPANTQTCDNPKTECTKAGKANKAVRPNPFEGLNLTEQQKTELQSIAPKKDCCKDKAEKKDRAQAKAEKQAKRAENRQKMIQNRRDYLAKVKNILTPEQYVQFLENNYVDQALKGGPRHGKMAQAKHKNGKKGDRRHNMRVNRPNTNAAQQQNANDSNSAYYIDNGKIKVFSYHAQR